MFYITYCTIYIYIYIIISGIICSMCVAKTGLFVRENLSPCEHYASIKKTISLVYLQQSLLTELVIYSNTVS